MVFYTVAIGSWNIRENTNESVEVPASSQHPKSRPEYNIGICLSCQFFLLTTDVLRIGDTKTNTEIARISQVQVDMLLSIQFTINADTLS